MNQSDGTVSEIEDRSGQLQRTIRVGPSPIHVAADADSVWVVNTGDSTLSRIAL